jgi:hypothetical protein
VNPTLVAFGLGGLTVATTLTALDNEEYGPILEAKVVNVGPYPIGKVHVLWNGRWEPSGDSQIIGKGFHFAAIGSRTKQLAPGKSATFALLKPHLQAGLSYAASLSPDQYRIEVHASHPDHPAMHEIHRVPGSEMGDLIDRLEHLLETEESK